MSFTWGLVLLANLQFNRRTSYRHDLDVLKNRCDAILFDGRRLCSGLAT
jgi:hypothetical protein